jgi:UDP-3-O-[3-hydroxymyristoyl] glucosamine N-acyltransferase
VIGRDCILYPNSVVLEECVIGDRVILQSACVVGGDGYGFATHKGADGVVRHQKIPQVGNVVLGDDVEIGGGATIDRAALGSTVIGRGTKIGDGVSIGHNVKVGEHGLIVSQVGISGSTVIGDYVTIAGQAGIAGHLKIGNRVTVAGQSGVMDDIADQSVVMGLPAMAASHTRRIWALIVRFPDIFARLKRLEHAVDELGDAGDDANEPGNIDRDASA